MKNTIHKGICATLLALGCVAAHAQFAGHRVEGQWFRPDKNTAHVPAQVKTVAASGADFNLVHSLINMVISDAQIELGPAFAGTTILASNAFYGARFRDIDGAIPPITGIAINPASDIQGVDGSRIEFDTDNIWVNLQGISMIFGQKLILDVQFASPPPPPSPQSIPTVGAPALVLATLSIGGLAGLISRRRSLKR